MHKPFTTIVEPQTAEYHTFRGRYLRSSVMRFMSLIGIISSFALAAALSLLINRFGHNNVPFWALFAGAFFFNILSAYVNARRELASFLDNGWTLTPELISTKVERSWVSPLDPITSFDIVAEAASGIGLSKIIGYEKSLQFSYDPFQGTMQVSRYRTAWLGLSIEIVIKVEKAGECRVTVKSKPGLSAFYFQNGDAFHWTTKISQHLEASILNHYEQKQQKERNQVLERAALESKLAALQAQVEPHFLFNTLANLKYLIRTNPDTAQQLLSSLVAYLQTAMPDMRSISSKLARECTLAQHFLTIMQIRMGQRLHFSIDYPKELADTSMPPAMLISLVENAIKHGLEKATRAGTVTIDVSQQAQRMCIKVSDDGVGLNDFGGNGVGLSNIYERLQLLYGDRAELVIDSREPSGVEAKLYLPIN